MKLKLLVGLLAISTFGISQLPSTLLPNDKNDEIKPIEKGKKLWHRARINFSSNEQIALLAAQGVPLDHGKKKAGHFIESDFSENEIAIARMLGCQVDILIEDVSQFYKDQNLKENVKPVEFIEKNASCTGGVVAPQYDTPVNWELGSMGGFYTYSEMVAELDQMATAYPNLITVKAPIKDNGGTDYATIEGRPIYWVKISDNPNTDEAEPEMLYDAIHHAREPAAMQQLIYYMWFLLENYATNPEVQGIIDNTELFFIPVLNPDGYQYNSVQDPNGGGMWRKNRRDHGNGDYGVDNNRNYDFIDGGGSSTWGGASTSQNTGSDVYCGTGPFSEIENQAMKSFCEQHEFRLALNNHTWDNSLLYPYGYASNELTPENATYVAISDMMVENNGQGMVAKLSSTLYPAAGDSDDWQYGADLATKPRIFSFTPEIGDDSFWPASNTIESICNSMVWTNLTSAHLITNYSKTSDASPSSVVATSGNFEYNIQRLGLEDPANFTVSFNPVSANILAMGGPNSHTAMTMLQTDLGTVSYTLDPAINDGDLIEYEILVNNGYFTETIAVTKTFGQATPIFTDNADDLNNWSVSQTWNTTTSDYYSATSSITDSPNGDYNNNVNKTITMSSAVDLSTALSANVTFYAKWEIETGYDYVQFEVSTNGGSSWTPQCGKYTVTGNGDQDQGKPLYDGFQTSWVQEEIDLSDYLGQSIMFRFQIRADGGVTEDGFYFDDLEVNVIEPNSNSLDEMAGFEINGYPNPTNDLFNITYVVPGVENNATLTMTNSVGQVINVITLSGNKGLVQIPTATLAEGMYFYHITNGANQSSTKKVMVTK
jgi:hypothetical protein